MAVTKAIKLRFCCQPYLTRTLASIAKQRVQCSKQVATEHTQMGYSLAWCQEVEHSNHRRKRPRTSIQVRREHASIVSELRISGQLKRWVHQSSKKTGIRISVAPPKRRVDDIPPWIATVHTDALSPQFTWNFLLLLANESMPKREFCRSSVQSCSVPSKLGWTGTVSPISGIRGHRTILLLWSIVLWVNENNDGIG